ncbi:MAG: hypothetical protein AAFY50_17695, partial [Cyanobacteria bacterium J06648_1]
SQSQSESAEPDVKEPTAEVPVAEVPVAEVPKVAPTDSEATPNSPAAESNVQADSSATPEADS